MESEQSPEQSPEQSGLSEKLSGDTQRSVGNSKDLRDLIRGGCNFWVLLQHVMLKENMNRNNQKHVTCFWRVVLIFQSLLYSFPQMFEGV